MTPSCLSRVTLLMTLLMTNVIIAVSDDGSLGETSNDLATGGCHYMRLHWQPGYNWQQKGHNTPQDWCLTYTPNSNKSNALLRKCKYKSSGTERRQKWRIENKMIKTCDREYCLTRRDDLRGRWVEAAKCGSTPDHEDRQEWIVDDSKKYKGNFEGKDYDFTLFIFKNLKWKNTGPSMRCLTNWYHHPKQNEALHLAKCYKLVKYKTLYWNMEERGIGFESETQGLASESRESYSESGEDFKEGDYESRDFYFYSNSGDGLGERDASTKSTRWSFDSSESSSEDAMTRDAIIKE